MAAGCTQSRQSGPVGQPNQQTDAGKEANSQDVFRWTRRCGTTMYHQPRSETHNRGARSVLQPSEASAQALDTQQADQVSKPFEALSWMHVWITCTLISMVIASIRSCSVAYPFRDIFKPAGIPGPQPRSKLTLTHFTLISQTRPTVVQRTRGRVQNPFDSNWQLPAPLLPWFLWSPRAAIGYRDSQLSSLNLIHSSVLCLHLHQRTLIVFSCQA